MSTIGNRLKIIRENKGISQMQVYKDIGIHNKTLSGYERGVSEPDLQTLFLLATYYKVSTDYLLGITDVKNPSTTYKMPNHGLDENLGKLINVSQNLSPEQLQKLSEFLESLYKK